MYLYDSLKEYSGSGVYPFHMPGHKRNMGITGAELPYEIDITEITGFDDLHHAAGILLKAEERAARLFHAEETHYLVNGSTAGILSAVLGCVRPGGRILMARNCHKAVYNALILGRIDPVYLYPEMQEKTAVNGGIAPEEVERILSAEKGIEAVIITSPTYDGVVSDVKAIAEIVHRRGIPLIVDEAHGAHFGFHPYFPENSCQKGADVVIQSVHKTLPALTQTALLHMNGMIADRERIRRYLHILQSSSPSYVLMAGIDECIRTLEEKGEVLFSQYAERLERTRRRLGGLRNLRLFETERYDPSKILLCCDRLGKMNGEEIKKYTGKCLYDDLRDDYLLELEMAAPGYALAITSVADTEQGLERLVRAAEELDRELMRSEPGENGCLYGGSDTGNRAALSPAEADALLRRLVGGGRERCGTDGIETAEIEIAGFEAAAGKTALEFAYVYPPGIPFVVPGESISDRTAEMLVRYERQGFEIVGTEKKGRIKVLADG